MCLGHALIYLGKLWKREGTFLWGVCIDRGHYSDQQVARYKLELVGVQVEQLGHGKGRGWYFYRKGSENGVTVFCSSQVLSFYFHSFCSTDLTVGFVCLMFVCLFVNESTYHKIVIVTETVFTKWTLAWELLVMNCNRDLRENSTVGLVAAVLWQTDWRLGVVCM